MKIITITGYKGGVAKTTTALHLADYFASFGKTLLIDCDQNKSCVDWYENRLNPNFEVVDEDLATRHIAGNDFIIFDTKARPRTNDIEIAAKEADLLILPTSPDPLSYNPIFKLMQDVYLENMRVLLTMIPKPPSTEGNDVWREMKSGEVPIFETRIRTSDGYSRAYSQSRTISQVMLKDGVKPDYRKRKFGSDYNQLGSEILNTLGIRNQGIVINE